MKNRILHRNSKGRNLHSVMRYNNGMKDMVVQRLFIAMSTQAINQAILVFIWHFGESTRLCLFSFINT